MAMYYGNDEVRFIIVSKEMERSPFGKTTLKAKVEDEGLVEDVN